MNKLIQEKLQKLHDFLRKNLSKEDRRSNVMYNIRNSLKESFKFLFVKDLNKIKSKIYGIIILNSGGLPIYTKYIDEGMLKDSSIISGLISAVNSFSKDIITTSSGALQSIKHEQFTIILEQQGELIFSMIAEKENFDLKNKFYQFITKIEKIEFDPDDVEIIEKIELPLNTIFDKIFGKNLS